MSASFPAKGRCEASRRRPAGWLGRRREHCQIANALTSAVSTIFTNAHHSCTASARRSLARPCFTMHSISVSVSASVSASASEPRHCRDSGRGGASPENQLHSALHERSQIRLALRARREGHPWWRQQPGARVSRRRRPAGLHLARRGREGLRRRRTRVHRLRRLVGPGHPRSRASRRSSMR